MLVSAVVLSCLGTAGLIVIEQAPRAASPELVNGAGVIAWEGRMPMPTHLPGTPPMCNDPVWKERADAYLDKNEHAGGRLGLCYMLAGGGPPNNVDPRVEERPKTTG